MKLLLLLSMCCCLWENSIHNPLNEEYVIEVAFNLSKPADLVTQEEFNHRYVADSSYLCQE